MVVGVLRLEIRLEGCRSLKAKRQLLLSLMERLRKDRAVAFAEVGDHKLWGNASIGVATVSGSGQVVEATLQRILETVKSEPQLELAGFVRDEMRL